jgi:LysM repeat protein
MRKISFWLLIFTCTASLAFAQDAATQQQIDKLSGQIQDLLESQAVQAKRLDALEKEIGDLRDKVSQPATSDSASADDLKKLAAQVQEIDQKRVTDNQQIMKAISKLGSAGARRPAPAVATDNSPPAPTPGGKQKGYDYEIHAGDTLSAVAKAYRDQGVKVTTTQILAANPGLTPTNMKVGQKIFIPDPNAK